MRPRTRSRTIQLGVTQFAVVVAGVLTVAAVLWALHPYYWQDLYHRDVVIPRMQKSHGFGWGPVTFRCWGAITHKYHGVTSVLPGGRLSQLGFRPGDVPFTRHGGGYGVLYHALQAADQKRFADVDVVNAEDCSAGKQEFRTVALHPQIRGTPASLVARTVLLAPTGSQAIEVTRSVHDEAPHEVWLIDLADVSNVADGSSSLLWKYEDRAKATWSEGGDWMAVTDDPLGLRSRCLLLDIKRQASVDPLEKLPSLSLAMRPSVIDDRTQCEIFGWVRDEPTRVALTVFTFYPAPGEPWRFDYFFDVATGSLVAAGSR